MRQIDRTEPASPGRVPGNFRELGDRPGMADRQYAIRPVPLRRARRGASARSRRDEADAARRRGARHAGRSRRATRHQAGAVRPGLGRPGGQRRRAHLLHSGAARRARRRCAPSALHRDAAPARLPPDGAGDAGRRYVRRSRRTAPEPSTLVGRATEMEELVQRFERALSGQRQIVFVTGEPGIGKSALAKEFADRLDRAAMRLAHGQCLDHHGVGEPYLPLIEALTRLAGAADGAAVKDILSTHAPSWLAQMPSLWTRAERSALEARGQRHARAHAARADRSGRSHRRRRRSCSMLEDIHWSDASTLDWLAHVARRPEPARLMMLATFRPADAAAIKRPRRHHVGAGAARALPRDRAASARPRGDRSLSGGAGSARRAARPPRTSRALLLERTGGNPLFMVSIVNQLRRSATPRASARSRPTCGASSNGRSMRSPRPTATC